MTYFLLNNPRIRFVLPPNLLEKPIIWRLQLGLLGLLCSWQITRLTNSGTWKV